MSLRARSATSCKCGHMRMTQTIVIVAVVAIAALGWIRKKWMPPTTTSGTLRSEDANAGAALLFRASPCHSCLLRCAPYLTDANGEGDAVAPLRQTCRQPPKPSSRLDAPLGDAPPVAMSGSHSDTAPARSGFYWFALLDFLQTTAAKDGTVQTRALDVP